MTERTSLTAPWDTDKVTQQLLPTSIRLSEEEVTNAKNELIVPFFPKIDRAYADDTYRNQVYCIHSFIPSKGAKPDEHGTFGFMKCRGVFSTEEEAKQRSEHIIRNLDSYHSLQISYCGKPFPVAEDVKKFASELDEVDIRKKVVKDISEDIKQKRLEDKKAMEEIQQRERQLREDVSKTEDEIEPIENYITSQLKKSQLIVRYKELRKTLSDHKRLIAHACQHLTNMEKEDPTIKDNYMERYVRAREEVGLNQAMESFMQYMGEELELDFDPYTFDYTQPDKKSE